MWQTSPVPCCAALKLRPHGKAQNSETRNKTNLEKQKTLLSPSSSKSPCYLVHHSESQMNYVCGGGGEEINNRK